MRRRRDHEILERVCLAGFLAAGVVGCSSGGEKKQILARADTWLIVLALLFIVLAASSFRSARSALRGSSIAGGKARGRMLITT